MKRIFLWLISILVSTAANAWMQNQYTLSYDSNFNPIVSVQLTNSTGKTVSNIDFVIFIREENSSQWDVMAVKELHINQATNMPPSTKREFTLKPNVPNGWKVNKVGVEKIRFFDNTIKQY